MCDINKTGLDLVAYTETSRRQFMALGAAATAAASLAGCATGQTAAAGSTRDVIVKTADGDGDAALFLPAVSRAPGVLVWPDAGGLRPSFRDIGQRLANMGYVALVVNPYYRGGNAASFVAPPAQPGAPPDEARRARMTAVRAQMTDDAIDRDAKAFVAYLDALAETSNAKVGVQGYCMGGPLSFRTAAANPARIGAVCTFHGGGLVTKNPNSPHLLIEKTNARFAVCVAKNDDAREPEAKTVLRETFDKSKKTAVVEVYGGDHGWCVPDGAAYNMAEAERAWGALTALYKSALA